MNAYVYGECTGDVDGEAFDDQGFPYADTVDQAASRFMEDAGVDESETMKIHRSIDDVHPYT